MLRTIITAAVATLLLSTTLVYADDKAKNLNVIAVHQIDDEALASFDFFSAEMGHECGGKPSNRYRSYSRFETVAARKFELVVSALTQGFKLNAETLGCEGNAMKVGRIGVRK